MRYRFTLLILLFFAGAPSASCQVAEDYAVELSATTQVSPPSITLSWKRITVDPPEYKVYRKAKSGTSWGSPIGILTAADSSFTDTAVVVDSAYEYKVKATGASLISYGYIYAGIKCPAIHSRGTLVLFVDTVFRTPCAAGLDNLAKDLRGDGWRVLRHDVNRSLPDTTVKNIIEADASSYSDVKAVLLVGHIAVPYSGDLNPDGHPDHLGAWPSDVFYATGTTGWADGGVYDTSASYLPNRNVPGDGKWDQTTIPSSAIRQVSRIDYYNMPAFTATEVDMMNSYLARDHAYKIDTLPMRHRALINDNFGAFSGEAFAANGWRCFPPLLSRDSVAALPFISSLAADTYQWAYGCGGGTFTSAAGVGTTADFAANPINGIFTMLFGSYFGDWNVQNSFLRAPLCASTPALTSCWAGRPNWYMHHMALGDNIGYSTMLAQNNSDAIYNPSNYGARFVHVALMGDLSLRTDYIRLPSNVVIATTPLHGATISWTASPDPAVMGYYVYRSNAEYGSYQRLSSMLATTTFQDTVGTDGLQYYMVRPVKLEATPSGGYYNLGIGIVDSATVTYHPVSVENLAAALTHIELYPNPASDHLTVSIEAAEPATVTMYITDITGAVTNKVVKQLNAGQNGYRLNTAGMAPGMYMLTVSNGKEVVNKKWVKL